MTRNGTFDNDQQNSAVLSESQVSLPLDPIPGPSEQSSLEGVQSQNVYDGIIVDAVAIQLLAEFMNEPEPLPGAPPPPLELQLVPLPPLPVQQNYTPTPEEIVAKCQEIGQELELTSVWSPALINEALFRLNNNPGWNITILSSSLKSQKYWKENKAWCQQQGQCNRRNVTENIKRVFRKRKLETA